MEKDSPEASSYSNAVGLSKNELITSVGLKDEFEQQYISKSEHAVVEPALHELCAYADLLNISLDCLGRDHRNLRKSFLPTEKVLGQSRSQDPEKVNFGFSPLNG